MMRKLDKIYIENFKSIRHINLELSDLNVFIGANGVGKSNFVGIFKFLNKLINKQLQVFTGESGGAGNILYFGSKSSEYLAIKLAFANYTNGYECTLVPATGDNFLFREEKIWFYYKAKYGKPYDENLGEGHKESVLQDATFKQSSRVAKYVYNDLTSWKLYHFHDTSDSAKAKQTGDIEDNLFLQPDARNLAAFLYRLQKKYPDHFSNIEETVRLVAPFFAGFNLHPSRLNEEKIRLEWKEIGNDAYFNASSLSDGTLRFICLATLLLQPDLPTVVILDEPELGLHPYAIVVLADMLRSAASRTQVLVATQSVTLVNQFEPSNIIVVERENEQSVFRRLDKADMQDWLDEYGLGDLWEKNVIGGRP